jgi:hypothetical protein
MIENARTKVLWAMVVLTIVFVGLAVAFSPWWLVGAAGSGALVVLGICDFSRAGDSRLRG